MDKLQVCNKGLYSPAVLKYPVSDENWKFDQKVKDEITLFEKFFKSPGGNNNIAIGKLNVITTINAGKILLALLW